jgi:hypothetical protein
MIPFINDTLIFQPAITDAITSAFTAQKISGSYCCLRTAIAA